MVNLEVGKYYRFRYKTQSGNYRWSEFECVAQYLGHDDYGNYVISFRPLAGTSTMYSKFVISAEVAPIGKPENPKRIRAMTREEAMS